MKDRVLRIIEESNLTTKEFAEKVNVQTSQISHIKTGRNQVTLDIVTKILKAYPKISPDWLIFGNGDMFRNTDKQIDNQQIKEQKQPIQLEMDDLFAQVSVNQSNQPTEIEVTTDSHPITENDITNSHSIESKVNSDNSVSATTSINSDENSLSNTSSSEMSASASEIPPIENTNTNSNLHNPILQINSPISEPIHQPISGPDNSPKIQHFVKKIVVFYADKTYDEFIPNDN